MPKGAKALGPSSKANVIPTGLKTSSITGSDGIAFVPVQLPSINGPIAALTGEAATTVSALAEELTAAYEKVVSAHQAAQTSALQLVSPLQAEIEALKQLVVALKDENSVLKAQMAEQGPIPVLAVRASPLFKDIETKLQAAQSSNESLQAQLSSAQATVASLSSTATNGLLTPFYNALTALTVVRREDTALTSSPASLAGLYECSTIEPGSGEAVCFTLDVFEPAADESGAGAGDGSSAGAGQAVDRLVVEYTPGVGCEAHLPSFLHAPIQFTLAQMPMFLAKVTEALRHVKYDGSAEENGAAGTAAAAAGAYTPGMSAGLPPSVIKSQPDEEDGQGMMVLEGPAGQGEGQAQEAQGTQAGSGTPTISFRSRRTPAKAAEAIELCMPEGSAVQGGKSTRTPRAAVCSASSRRKAAGSGYKARAPTPAQPQAEAHACDTTEPDGTAAAAEAQAQAQAQCEQPAVPVMASSSGMAEGTAAAAEAAAAVEKIRTKRTRGGGAKGGTGGQAGGRRSVGGGLHQDVQPEGFLFVPSPGGTSKGGSKAAKLPGSAKAGVDMQE